MVEDVQLDAVDAALVRELVADGRLSMNELAARAGVSRATAYSRVERLRRDGVITGFTATVDPARVGYGVTALILLNVRQSDWREARDAFLAIPGLSYLAMTSGAFDMAMVVRAPGCPPPAGRRAGRVARHPARPQHADGLRARGARAAPAARGRPTVSRPDRTGQAA